MARTLIGELLKRERLIDDLQLQSAVAFQQQWGGPIGQAFVHLGFVPEPVLFAAIGRQLGVSFVEIGDRMIPPEVIRLLPEKLIRSRRAFPMALVAGGRRGELVVAMADPNNLHVVDDIAFATGLPVKPVLAGEADIDRAIARHLGGPVEEPRRSVRAIAVSDEPALGAAGAQAALTEFRHRRFH
jgi:type IV pilus assembly protein PilB